MILNLISIRVEKLFLKKLDKKMSQSRMQRLNQQTNITSKK